jgi:hypothetical protein
VNLRNPSNKTVTTYRKLSTMSLEDISAEKLEIYNKARMGSLALSSQVEQHVEMCSVTQAAVEDCFAKTVRLACSKTWCIFSLDLFTERITA